MNQVSLQSVSFAPTVTYAGQVSTGPAPVILSSNDSNKTLSGNDMPGYPRVNNGPPRSLNCNGYSGDFGGNQTNSQQQQHMLPPHQQQQQQQQTGTNQMHPPQIPQSPNRNSMSNMVNHTNMMQQITQSPNHHQNNNHQLISHSPNIHQQQNTPSYPPLAGTPHNQINQHSPASMQQQQQSPSHNNGQMNSMSHGIHNQRMHTPNPQDNHTSPGQNQDWSWNNSAQSHSQNDMFNQSDRINLNSRLKTMILSKNDQKDGSSSVSSGSSNTNTVGQQTQQTAGHFLSYSHHHRDNINNINSIVCSKKPMGMEHVGGGGESIWKSSFDDFQKVKDIKTNIEQLKKNEKKVNELSESEVKFKEQENSFSQAHESVNKIGDEVKNLTKEKEIKYTPLVGSDTKYTNLTTYPQQLIGFNRDDSPTIDKKPIFDNPGEFDKNLIIKTEGAFHQPNQNLTQLYPAGKQNQSMCDVRKGFQSASENDETSVDDDSKCVPTPKLTPNNLSQEKMEGYERNYQDFIKYADFCDAQQQNLQQPLTEAQNSYHYGQHNQNYYPDGYYPPYHPTYQQNYPQNYPELPTETPPVIVPAQPILPAATEKEPIVATPTKISTPPTNFEKEIPAHTYLNPGKFTIKRENLDDDWAFMGEGGPAAIKDPIGFSCCRKGSTAVPTEEHLKDGTCVGLQTKDEKLLEQDDDTNDGNLIKETVQNSVDRTEKGSKPEVPDCDCFPSDKNPPEPGSFYTHLGKRFFFPYLTKKHDDASA